MLYLAYKLFKRAVPVLVDHIALEPEQLVTAIRRVKGVRRVRRLRSRWHGGERIVDMIITVDPRLSTDDAHAISEVIEALLAEQFEVVDATIHIEPDSG